MKTKKKRSKEPVGVVCTIYYDYENGELDRITWSPRWKRELGLMKCDVIGDIQRELEEEYAKSSNQYFGAGGDLEKGMKT